MQLHVSVLHAKLNISQSTSYHPPIQDAKETANITICTILGDALLSTTAWFYSSSYTPMDLYNCCIVFKIPSPSHSSTKKTLPLGVPSVHVLSQPSCHLTSDNVDI